MAMEMEAKMQHQGFMMLRFRGISNEQTWQPLPKPAQNSFN